jgi:hypothetical protein
MTLAASSKSSSDRPTDASAPFWTNGTWNGTVSGVRGGGLEKDEGSLEEAVPRRTRWFVWAFLVAFVVCGLAGIEAWPLTGFRLFSHLRHEQATTWERTMIGSDGRERPITFARLSDGYRSFVLVVRSFPSKTKTERDGMCRDWVTGLRGLDQTVTGMRVYRLDQSLLPREGDRPAAPPARTLLFTCSEGGASMAGGS